VWDATYASEYSQLVSSSNANYLEEVTLCSIWEDVSGDSGEHLTTLVIDVGDSGDTNVDTDLSCGGNINDFIDVTLR
jgi:hypothetical protein